MTEFKVSKQYTDLLDANYAAGFEDFRVDAMENFPEVDFSSIKLNIADATSSLLQTSSEDINVEDDASTHHPKTTPMLMLPLLKDETFTLRQSLYFFFLSFGFCLVLSFGTLLCNQNTFSSSMVLGRGLKQSSVCFDLTRVFGRRMSTL